MVVLLDITCCYFFMTFFQHLIGVVDVHPAGPTIDIGVLETNRHQNSPGHQNQFCDCLNDEVLTSLRRRSVMLSHRFLIKATVAAAEMSTDTHVLCIPFLSISLLASCCSGGFGPHIQGVVDSCSIKYTQISTAGTSGEAKAPFRSMCAHSHGQNPQQLVLSLGFWCC